MLNEAVPNLCIHRGVFDRGVGENDGFRIDPFAFIKRQISHQIAIAITVLLVQRTPWTIFLSLGLAA